MTSAAAVADVLRTALKRSHDDYVESEPERGLYLQLSQVEGVLHLTLRREAAYPTASEVQKWADAFGIPDGMDHMRKQSWASTHPKTQRPIRWCAIKLKWREDLSTCATTA